MNAPAAELKICEIDQLVCLRVIGKASFNTSPDFNRVIAELARRGRTRYLVDLCECTMMDSTFLGVLIHYVVKYPPPGSPAPPLQFQLHKPTQRVLNQIDNLGVADRFQIIDHCDLPLDSCAPVTPPEQAATKAEMTKTSLAAHEALMAANPANVPRFKDVVRFLAEDLKKMDG